jgi:PAS domain S-box-containing protein
MSNTVTSAAPAFTGWEELGPRATGWKIERPELQRDTVSPFFPEQPSRTHDQMLYNLPVMLHCMDGSGRLLSVNKNWCDVFGYEGREVLGHSFNQYLAPQSRTQLVTQIYPKYLATGTCYNEELFVQRKDGSLATVLLTMTAQRSEKGRIERSICHMQDISQRKIAEIATGRTDMRFRSAFMAAAHGMAIVTPTGLIEVVNGALKDFTGRQDLETATFAFDEMLHKDDRPVYLNGVRKLLSGETNLFKHELRFVNGDADPVYGIVSVCLNRNEQGDTEQLTVQVVDVSERRQVAQRLQKAQKMEAIGQLTGGLAHDFNNLLTIIIGNLQLLDGKIVADEKAIKRLAEAQDAARKGSELTRQLLAFARKQELEPREVPVNDLVKGMEALIARTLGENMELKVHLMAGEPKVTIDPSQLESSILNLAINARDAMGNGGKLTIETQPAYLDHAYAEKHADVTPGHYVMVAVTDTGSGMSPELLDKVFQPFFTTKGAGKGSGLGLSMVYGFIKQSGGHINVYSEIGHGTSFKMYLPRRLSAAEMLAVDNVPPVRVVPQPVAAEPAAEGKAKPKAKILVVEDQEAVRAVACGFLEDFGYELVEAGDGFEALAKLQEMPDIDLMFSDVVMPGGMNGFDLAQAASGMRPGLKIVHTTGYPKGAIVHQDEPRFKEGFIIMKPYRREELEQIIANALEN